MSWAVDFNKLEEYESDNSELIWTICKFSGGVFLGWEKWPQIAHPYWMFETRFHYNSWEEEKDKDDDISEVDLDTQVFEADSQSNQSPAYWKIKAFNKVNEIIVGKELRERLDFQKTVDFEEDTNSQSENEELDNDRTRDTGFNSQISQNEEQADSKPKQKFYFEYKNNFWKRGGYISVRCPQHHLKRKFCSWNFNETEYDSSYEDDADCQATQNSIDEENQKKIDPNFLIFWDYWSK